LFDKLVKGQTCLLHSEVIDARPLGHKTEVQHRRQPVVVVEEQVVVPEVTVHDLHHLWVAVSLFGVRDPGGMVLGILGEAGQVAVIPRADPLSAAAGCRQCGSGVDVVGVPDLSRGRGRAAVRRTSWILASSAKPTRSSGAVRIRRVHGM
jgi:hypothetical protein